MFSRLGAILPHLVAHLASSGHLGAILGHPLPVLGHLGAILGHRGAILGYLGAILGHLGGGVPRVLDPKKP